MHFIEVVAILGRPNVGKSTLFNRLTSSKDALMTAYPGTTRDRQYGQVNKEGRRFIIIDTGGIVEAASDVDNLIIEQAKNAINEADKIIFLIDGKAGLTPDDLHIANRMRRIGKPLTLVVNKAEGMDAVLSSDAHELGLGDPVFISALHGQGISELLHALFKEPNAESIESSITKTLRLAIVGKPNVGKSTLTNRILGEERVIVHDAPGTTRDSISIPLERYGKQYTLIDTAGVRRKKNINELPEKFSVIKTLQSIESSNVVLYVIDARVGVTEQDLKLLGFVIDAGKGLVIAINKWDNMDETERQKTKNSIELNLDFVKFARIHFISALHGSGVGNLFSSVEEAYLSATRKLSTPILSRLLEEAQNTHQPPLVKGRRVKLRYAHAGGHNPPRIIIHGNQLDALPQSYKKFLAHFYQEKLKLFGTPLYIEFKTNKNPYNKST